MDSLPGHRLSELSTVSSVALDESRILGTLGRRPECTFRKDAAAPSRYSTFQKRSAMNSPPQHDAVPDVGRRQHLVSHRTRLVAVEISITTQRGTVKRKRSGFWIALLVGND